MRIGVLRTQVPFVTGGAERHSANLCSALHRFGHEAVEITLPFKWYPGKTLSNSILAAKLTDLTEFEGVPIDLLIGLKFPAYLADHPNKKFWIIHQHRQAYDQWDAGNSDLLHDPDGLALRHLIRAEDQAAFAASNHPIYANSKNVAGRLQSYLGVPAQPLYHPPPLAERMRQGKGGDYLFAPGRLNRSKRLELMLEALAFTKSSQRLVVAGVAENPAYFEELRQKAKQLNVSDQVEWLGPIDDEAMIELYAGARAVVFVPQDEDYGYVTLEAMLSGKPVITTTDAGGPLEFITDGAEGLITAPRPAQLAEAFERVMQDGALAEQLGRNGFERYQRMNIHWDHVVETLTGTARPKATAPHPVASARASPPEAPEGDPQTRALAALRAAIAPGLTKVDIPFKSISDVFEAYDFDTLPSNKGVPVDAGLISYLSTHWQRFLTTLDLITEIHPERVLDIGVFPPLAFEAMLVNALPGVEIDGVWEGPNPYHQQVLSRDASYPSFEMTLAPANTERDVLPYAPGHFDLVLGMEIFEHLALDPYFFLSQAARVLCDGGYILLTTPNIGSHRGVWKTLNGHAPYSFGLFVPTGGVYGRHNREWTPHEVEALAQSAGFETVHLKTVDVYGDDMDPGTAELLVNRGEDLSLRGETIFYLGRKTGAPSGPPEGYYHGDPVQMSGRLEVTSQEPETGLVRLQAENRAPVWWSATGGRAICLLAEWINAAGTLIHTNVYVPLETSVAPGDSQTLSLRLDKQAAEVETGTLKLHLYQSGVGSLAGTGRANTLELPCSEDAFLRLVKSAARN